MDATEEEPRLVFYANQAKDNENLEILYINNFGKQVIVELGSRNPSEQDGSGAGKNAWLSLTSFEKKIAMKELHLFNFCVEDKCLEILRKSDVCQNGPIDQLVIKRCSLNSNQKNLEDFICSLNLRHLQLEDISLQNGLQISDKILSSVKDEILFHQLRDPHRYYPDITDNLLEYWKKNPPSLVNLYQIRPSFTIRNAVNMIMLSLISEWNVTWVLGGIECRAEDGQYLLELQKTPGLKVYINKDYWTTTTQEVRRGHYSVIEFQCIYV